MEGRTLSFTIVFSFAVLYSETIKVTQGTLSMQRPGTPTTNINLGANGAVTATKTSTKINAGGYTSSIAFLDITAISGTSASPAVQFQDSADGVEWANIPSGAITAQTTTGETRVALANHGPYLQAVQTVAGTTSSITYDLKISGDS